MSLISVTVVEELMHTERTALLVDQAQVATQDTASSTTSFGDHFKEPKYLQLRNQLVCAEQMAKAQMV